MANNCRQNSRLLRNIAARSGNFRRAAKIVSQKSDLFYPKTARVITFRCCVRIIVLILGNRLFGGASDDTALDLMMKLEIAAASARCRVATKCICELVLVFARGEVGY